MGVVYEALDRDSGAHVALKTLRTVGGTALLRFKQEFRALTDIEHPNLIRLGELIEEDGTYFFTMELVQGSDVLAYVRPGDALHDELDSAPTEVQSHVRASRTEPVQTRSHGSGELDEARLRAVLPQLAAGLVALHDAGKVHRDVKPSNVLVSSEGRVAIVDFGLIADLAEVRPSEEGRVIGTLAYMAPEQAEGAAPGPQADWYALGVLLYRALTGVLPFSGSPMEVLAAKMVASPRPPRDLAPSVPADLEALCLELLRSDPHDRPSGREVLARLGADALAQQGPLAPLFVGRARELAELRRAYEDSRRATVTVVVSGESGIGKSALVAELARDARALGATILSGRCFERESLPYKGMDGVVDALSEVLATLPPQSIPISKHTPALVRMFPVLARVRVIAKAARVRPDVRDPAELRDRAFFSLRVMLSALAARAPLVVTIDDFHWADADSLRLLAALLVPPAPPLLVLLTARSLRSLAKLVGDVRRLEIGPLDDDAADALGRSLLSAVNPTQDIEASALFRAAGGNPLHLDALVRHAVTSPDSSRIDLDEALRRRAAQLGGDAVRVLELIAVADAPIARRVIGSAAGLGTEELARALAALRNAALVRASGIGRIEVSHGRVRAAVLGALTDDEGQRAHAALARALSADADAEPEEILRHLHAAQQLEGIADLARTAAERAMSALAFDRAAELYQLALDAGGSDALALTIGLGDALAAAGRGREAAAAYTRAANAAADSDALELRRRAADQLLRAGYVDEGVAEVQRSLAAVGLPFPSERWAMPSLLWQRARLTLRGLRITPRDADDVAPAELARIDACWTAALGLSMVSTVRGAELQSRHLRLALDAGERRRVVRALSLEASLAASRTSRRVPALLATARRLADADDPNAEAWLEGAAGVSEFFDGRWRAALDSLARAEQLLRDRCVGVAWDMATVRVFSAAAHFFVGELTELAERLEEHLEEARRRGDLYAQVNLATGYGNVAWLVRNEPAHALTELRAAVARWSRAGFHVQHWYAMRAEAIIALYCGDTRGHEAYSRSWRALERSLLRHNRAVRAESHLLRARLAIAAARRDDVALLSEAEHSIGRAERERAPWVHALAGLARAGIARCRGDHEDALARLRQARAACEAADMTLFAAAAGWAAGAIVGGDEGAGLARDGANAIAAHVRRPEMFARVLLGWDPAAE